MDRHVSAVTSARMSTTCSFSWHMRKITHRQCRAYSHTHRIIYACRPMCTHTHTHSHCRSFRICFPAEMFSNCQWRSVDPWTRLKQLKDSCAEGFYLHREDTHSQTKSHKHTHLCFSHQYFIVLCFSQEFSFSSDPIVWASSTSPPLLPSFPITTDCQCHTRVTYFYFYFYCAVVVIQCNALYCKIDWKGNR